MTTPAPIGLYHPGASLVHRMPAGWKLLGLLGAMTGIMWLSAWWQLGIAAAVTTALYAVAGIPARIAWAQLRPLRFVVIVIALLQLWLADWHSAVRICATLVIALALAALVTLTTRVSAMLDTIARLLRPGARLGIDPERIGLLLAATIRCIPLVTGIVAEVTEARKARGLGFSLRSLGAPLVIRSLRAADALGEALIARGADD